MMFSTKAEYGIRVLVELASRDGDAPVPLAEIAEANGLPLAYLEHLVARLRKAGLVESRRGARGGYLLARGADDITMAEVVEALEVTIALKSEHTTEADPEDRAHAGLFLAFQYPVAIPGVSIANFLRMAINTGRKENPINVKEFRDKLQHAIEMLDVDRAFTSRHL